MTFDESMLTKRGDLELILQALAKEERSLREYINKYSGRLQKDRALRDNEDLLLRTIHLKERLSAFPFCIALPFGIGDSVYTIEETKNEFYEVCEDKLYGMEIGKDSSGVMNVVFHLEYNGFFELKDIGKTAFRWESGARKRCSDLNKKDT